VARPFSHLGRKVFQLWQPARFCQHPTVIAVQPLTPDDWAQWRALRIEATTTEPEAFGSTLAEVAATTEAQWRARLSTPSLHLVARQESDAVGMAAVNHEFELGSVWVRPNARGSGTGHRLVEAALRWAASREAPLVRLASIHRSAPVMRRVWGCGGSHSWARD